MRYLASAREMRGATWKQAYQGDSNRAVRAATRVRKRTRERSKRDVTPELCVVCDDEAKHVDVMAAARTRRSRRASGSRALR